MADRVEEIMEDMVQELDDLRRKRIFNDDEIREIVKRRRDFEYLIQKTPTKQQYFLSYARYEVAVECLRSRRSKALNWRTRSISDWAGVKRLHKIFNRGTLRFKSDLRMWYQHIDFCLRTGSTKILSSMLLRALRWHPREIPIWLLAADRELKQGNVKTARALLVRGLRFVPKSAKLLGEFLRLELQVAGRLRAFRDGVEARGEEEGAEKKQDGKNPWAPSQLVLRQAMSRLKKPESSAVFLGTAVECLSSSLKDAKGDVRSETDPNFCAFATQVRTALAERRPGVCEGKEWEEVAEDTAFDLWRLWWEHERQCGVEWKTLVEGVLASAPQSVVRRFAFTLGAIVTSPQTPAGEAEALVQLSKADKVAADAETAVALCETLHRCAGNNSDAAADLKKAMSDSLHSLLSCAAGAHPTSAKLQLAAWNAGIQAARKPEELAQGAQLMNAGEAASVRLVADMSSLETLMRGLATTARCEPLVSAHLAQGLVSGSHSGFSSACEEVRSVAARVWDLPGRRAEMLACVLDAELRTCSSVLFQAGAQSAAVAEAHRLVGRFEELLSSLDDADPGKEDWWVRFLEFVQRFGRWGVSSGLKGVSGSLPDTTDLHWRAMRSVANQASYSEKAHKLLQQQFPGC